MRAIGKKLLCDGVINAVVVAALLLGGVTKAHGDLIGGVDRGDGPQPLVIDDFIDIQQPWPIRIDSGVSMDGNMEAGLNGVLGGARNATLSNGMFGTALDFAEATVAPNVSGGVLDYSSTVMASARLSLVYGANVPAFDLSQQAGIIIDLLAFDFPKGGPLDVSVILISNGESQTVSTLVSATEPGEVLLSFDDLSSRGAFDLADVDDIALRFDAEAGSDFRIGAVRTRLIPAPGAVALLVVAGLLGWQSRRRRSAVAGP